MTRPTAEERFADGQQTAARAIYLDGIGINNLDTRHLNLSLPRPEVREAPDGSGGSKLTFTGYASVYEKPYTIRDYMGDYEETVHQGSFRKTLTEGADYAFLINHDGSTLARTKAGNLRTNIGDQYGFFCEAEMPMTREDVRVIRENVDSGNWDEMSFAFRVTRQEWDEDFTARSILEVNMNQGDQSIVNFGASPHTAGSPATALRCSSPSLAAAQRSALTSTLNRRGGELRSVLGQAKLGDLVSALGLLSEVPAEGLAGSRSTIDEQTVRSVFDEMDAMSDEELHQFREDPTVIGVVRRLQIPVVIPVTTTGTDGVSLGAPATATNGPIAEMLSTDLALARAFALRQRRP